MTCRDEPTDSLKSLVCIGFTLMVRRSNGVGGGFKDKVSVERVVPLS